VTRLLTAEQLADVLQIHVETVYRYVRIPESEGGVPRLRWGPRLRFDPDRVLEWMATRSAERDGRVAALTPEREGSA
jgi:excisionase family DNA binding protein